MPSTFRYISVPAAQVWTPLLSGDTAVRDVFVSNSSGKVIAFREIANTNNAFYSETQPSTFPRMNPGLIEIRNHTDTNAAVISVHFGSQHERI